MSHINKVILVLFLVLCYSPLIHSSDTSKNSDLFEPNLKRALATTLEYPPSRIAKIYASPSSNGLNREASPLQIIRQMFRDDGMRAFFTGGSSFIIRRTMQWGGRGVLKTTIDGQIPGDNHRFYRALTLGFGLGLMDAITGCAADQINTIFTTTKNPKWEFQNFRPYISYELKDKRRSRIAINYNTLYKTLGQYSASSVLIWTGFFGIWEILKPTFKSKETGEVSPINRALMGIMSGTMAFNLTAPYHYRVTWYQAHEKVAQQPFLEDVKRLYTSPPLRKSLMRFTAIRNLQLGFTLGLTGWLFMEKK